MSRRDSLKLCGLGAGLIAWPALASAPSGAHALIFDGRFAAARALAHGCAEAHDCQVDAAALWFRSFAGKASTIARIEGLTGTADALILADCARREGLRFEQPGKATSQLVAWQITRKGRA